MEGQLDSLIQRIREEGVEGAKKKAEEIIKQAEDRAAAALKDAEKKKEIIIQKGRQEATDLVKNGEEALRQASRDLLLSLRQSVVELFDKIVKREVSKALSADNLKEIIVKAVENFKKEGLDIEVLLSKEDKEGLEAALLRSLKEELRKGVVFKASSGVEKGFRIGEKDRNFYYDFTDDAIKEALALYLNPRIKEILNLNSKDGK